METLKIKSIITYHKAFLDFPETTHENCVAYVPLKLTIETGQMRATVAVARNKASAGKDERLASIDFWMEATDKDADVLDEFKRLAMAGELPEVKGLVL